MATVSSRRSCGGDKQCYSFAFRMETPDTPELVRASGLLQTLPLQPWAYTVKDNDPVALAGTLVCWAAPLSSFSVSPDVPGHPA